MRRNKTLASLSSHDSTTRRSKESFVKQLCTINSLPNTKQIIKLRHFVKLKKRRDLCRIVDSGLGCYLDKDCTLQESSKVEPIKD